jgi:4-amino-4-deoxy-L-arabinose transferase-like glycosyltransferase
VSRVTLISILAITILVGIILVVLVWKKRKTGVKQEPDYQAFFTMGLSFIAMGTALSIVINPGFLGFLALGIIYMLWGLKNKDKWKKKE